MGFSLLRISSSSLEAKVLFISGSNGLPCLHFSLVTAFQHPLAQAWALFLTGCEWISASPHALYELQGNNWLYHNPHHGLQRNLSSNARSTSSPSLFSPTLVLPCWVSSSLSYWEISRLGYWKRFWVHKDSESKRCEFKLFKKVIAANAVKYIL